MELSLLSKICLVFTGGMVLVFLFWKYIKRKTKQNSLQDNQDEQLLTQHVPFYQALDVPEKKRFLAEVRLFLGQVHIEGVGTEVEELDRVLVAASAIIPIFSFKDWRYRNLTNVILYPDTFNQAFQYEGNRRHTLGMVGDGSMNGQMLLSKKALHAAFSGALGANNTAIHEFVHLIDKSDGSVDGMPEILLAKPYLLPWLKLMHQEMKKIQQGRSDIDPYALTNEAEFFAVAAEYFFEDPKRFQQRHPDLYRLLSQIFQKEEN